MDLTQLRNQIKDSESRWNMKYLAFDKRLREIEQELLLPPYARLSDVIRWCEKLIHYEQKLELMRQSTVTLSQKGWERLEEKVLEYYKEDQRAVSILSEYVCFLVNLEKKYDQRFYVFLNFLDNCMRYVRSYSEDLEKNGLSITGTISKVKQLGAMYWINGKAYQMKLEV